MCTISGTFDPVQLAQCVDVDECDAATSPCPPIHACVNFLGSFACGPTVEAVNIPEVINSTMGGDILTITLQGPCL
jgi:hypothetical protein